MYRYRIQKIEVSNEYIFMWKERQVYVIVLCRKKIFMK